MITNEKIKLTSHSKLKILFVTPYFYPKHGGLEKYAFNIAKGLKELGHEVVVITSNHIEPSRESIESLMGLRIYRLSRQFKLSNTPVNLRWRQQIKTIIAMEKPDIINAHTPVPGIADATERVRGTIPFVLTYHNDLNKPSLFGNMLAKMAYTLFGITKTLQQSDSIIATSEYYASHSPHLVALNKKIDIVTPGVDLNKFHPKLDKKWLSNKCGTNEFIVLFVGQLDKSHSHKGVKILVDALAFLNTQGKKIHLVIVGGGDAINEYKAYARDKGLIGVTFSGYVEDKELPKYYVGANVGVLPSITSSEGFGMTLIEANSCGIPVIGSKIGGIPHAIINGKTGLLVEPNNTNALASAIAKFYDDPALAKKLGTAGASRVRHKFGWNHLITETEQIFLRTIKEYSI